MREEVLVVGGAVADLVDSRYPSIDVVSVGPLRPCLMYDRNPQVAFMAAVRHVGPEAQREVRDDVVCGRVLAKAVSQVVYRVPVQSVGVVDLSSLIRPENRAPYGRGIVEQPVVGPAPSGGYCPVVRVPEGDLEERDVFQDGLRKAYVPEVEVECDGSSPRVTSRYLLYRGSESHDMTCARSIFGAFGMGNLSSENN